MAPQIQRLGLFGQRLKLMRISAELTQDDLADRVGLTRSSIANIEAGRQDPPLSRILCIAAALDCPLGVLVGEVDDERIGTAVHEELARIAAQIAALEEERRLLRSSATTRQGS